MFADTDVECNIREDLLSLFSVTIYSMGDSFDNN